MDYNNIYIDIEKADKSNIKIYYSNKKEKYKYVYIYKFNDAEFIDKFRFKIMNLNKEHIQIINNKTFELKDLKFNNQITNIFKIKNDCHKFIIDKNNNIIDINFLSNDFIFKLIDVDYDINIYCSYKIHPLKGCFIKVEMIQLNCEYEKLQEIIKKII